MENESVPLTESKYIVSKYKRKLNIKNPTTADSGIYECVVTSSNYPTVRASAHLTVLGKFSINIINLLLLGWGGRE